MKKLLLSLSILCLCMSVYCQANGSFFTLQLGSKICLFKYQEKPDSTSVEVDSAHSREIVTQINPVTLQEKTKWVKDTVVMRKALSLQDTSLKTIHTKETIASDTLTAIDIMTLAETITVVKYNEARYHVEATMSYSDFLIMLKSRFELKNPQKKLRVYSYTIYYETADTSGLLIVNYPQTSQGVISKLNCLAKNGGLILLSLREADHGEVRIDSGDSFLALIRIKN